MKIQLDVKGIKSFEAKLTRTEIVIKDFRTIFKSLLPLLRRLEAEQFSSEGRAGSPPAWAPLSQRYAKRKRKLYPGRGILVRTGRLEASLTGQSPDSIVKISHKSMTFGSALGSGTMYGRWAALGFTARGGRQIAPRRPIALSESQRQEILEHMAKRLGVEITQQFAQQGG